jgi:hypothetical protein
MYTLDLTGYKETLSATVPDGRYLVQVDDYELTKTKSTQKDMFNVWLRIVEGEYAGEVVIDRLTVTDKALFRIVGFLNGLGIPTPKKRLALDPNKWTGRKVWVDLEIGEPYRGRPGKSEVRGYVRYVPGEAAPQAAPGDVPGTVERQSTRDELDEFATAQGVVTDTPAEADTPATASPSIAEAVEAKVSESETINLSDIEGL